ncbi:MAG: hypothetical protein QCH35_08375 [Methanomicrobiaceae archaeon]|nr:hypothetical protein [Methanomicrobiaceae archaeon]
MASTYAAFSVLDAAIDRTKALLWPVDPGVWLRLAVIAFFVGGTGFNIPSGPSYSFSGDEFAGIGPADIGIPGGVPGFLVLLLALIFAVAIVFWMIGAIFQFVFVDSLRTGEVAIRRYFGPRAGKGFRLFLFEAGLAVLILLVVAVPIALFIFTAGGFASNIGALVIVPFFLLFISAVFVLAILLGLIMLFTIDFVVPIMIRDDCGVIDGWRSAWRIIRTEWKQALVYAVVKFLLGIAVGILMIIAVVVAAIILAIPFVIVGFLIAVAGGSVPIYIVLVALFVLFLIVAALFISVPFVTFLRYYSLEVLAAIAPEYTLLPGAGLTE